MKKTVLAAVAAMFFVTGMYAANFPAYLKMSGTKITGCEKDDIPDNLVIPKGVTEIGDKAFKQCMYLESVEIPGTVKVIGEEAFDGCTSLKSITIAEGVTKIGKNAFDCTALTSVTIPASVTIIESAFSGRNIAMVRYTGTLAQWCQMDNKPFADEVKTITLSDVADLKKMTTLTIPNGVTKIGRYAFSGCKSLANVTIPESVTKIGWSAFEGCSSLVSITIPESVKEIEPCAFGGTGLKTVTIPKGIKGISMYTPIDGISEFTFIACKSLESVTLPRSVTTIGMNAFSGCSSLKTVSMPRSVTRISEDAFYGCNNLIIQFDGTKAQWEDIRRYGRSIGEFAVHCTDGDFSKQVWRGDN